MHGFDRVDSWTLRNKMNDVREDGSPLLNSNQANLLSGICIQYNDLLAAYKTLVRAINSEVSTY